MNVTQHEEMPSQLNVEQLLVRKFGILSALIAADLKFWLVKLKKENRWTRYERWAEMFDVSYSTVKREKKNLEQMFDVSRTRINVAGVSVLGANNFKLKASQYDEVESTKFSSIVFPMEYIRLAKELAPTGKAPEFAWFLYRVGWLMYRSKIDKPNRTVTTFKSMAWLAGHCNLSIRTLERYSEHCRKIGCITIMGKGIAASTEWEKEIVSPIERIYRQFDNSLNGLINDPSVPEPLQCWAIDKINAAGRIA